MNEFITQAKAKIADNIDFDANVEGTDKNKAFQLDGVLVDCLSAYKDTKYKDS